MAKVDRAKLKRLLKELDSEKVRTVRKKAESVGVAARAKAGEFVTEQKRLRTPEARTAQAAASRAEQVTRQKSEATLKAEREQELEALREASAAEVQRKRVEREIFEQKYGVQIQQAKKLGRGVAKGTAVAATALGKGLVGLGKLAAGTETLEETRRHAQRVAETGKRRGFVAEPLRELARERQSKVRERRREDISSFFESEGVTPQEARRERQAGGAFDFPSLEIDIGF